MSQTDTHKAFCCIVHEAQLEALLILEALGQRVSHVIRGQRLLSAVLELGKDRLGANAMSTQLQEPLGYTPCCYTNTLLLA